MINDIIEALSTLIKGIAEAVGESEEKIIQELAKRHIVTDTAAEDLLSAIEKELPK